MSENKRRVAITGIGVVSPLGNDLATTWEAMKAGKSGVAKIKSMENIDKFPVKIGAELKDFDPVKYFNNSKDVRRTDPYCQYGIAATKMAFEDSGLDADKVDKSRFGVIIGSGIGGLQTLEKQYEVFYFKGMNRVSPFVIPMLIANILSGMASMEYGFRGPNMSVVTACATSNHAIGEAYRLLQHGDADYFLAGGAEAPICNMAMIGFSKSRAMSLRMDEPERASRPFDKERDGFVIGEGAGVVVLEDMELAKKRGANIYCELVGYGLSADAYHMTAPHPEGIGAKECMQMALKQAKFNPSDIGYINTHGTSTPMGDACETKAIKDAFGSYAYEGLQISSTKSMTGHLLGAAGGVELAASIMAMKEGIIPPTINYENPDPECDLDYTPNTAREAKIDTAISNSFGFGGHNASLIVKKV